MIYVCFFKQKTAYEMRISDWSSDVCSSDLAAGNGEQERRQECPPEQPAPGLRVSIAVGHDGCALGAGNEMGAGVHVDDPRLRGIDGAVPAAAERLVEGDVVGGDGDPALDQRVLGRIERALRIQPFVKDRKSVGEGKSV